MPSVDSNILLRYIVRDNQEQARVAERFIDNLTPEQPGFICREVVLETVWVLEGSYKFSRARIAKELLNLMDEDGIVVENSEDVANALQRYEQSNIKFSHLMFLAASKRAGAEPLCND